MGWFKGLLKKSPSLYTAGAAVRAIRDQNSYLVTTGYARSLHEGVPCRRDGSPIPWMNYSVVDFLDERLGADMSLFEYGSGYSTLYYASHVAVVHAVENNADWHRSISGRLAGTGAEVDLVSGDPEAYIRTIRRRGIAYDVVVVDGWRRALCCAEAADVIGPSGVILLDDSQRTKFAAAFTDLAARGFSHLTFTGLKPTGREPSSTTVFYRRDNVFGL